MVVNRLKPGQLACIQSSMLFPILICFISCLGSLYAHSFGQPLLSEGCYESYRRWIDRLAVRFASGGRLVRGEERKIPSSTLLFTTFRNVLTRVYDENARFFCATFYLDDTLDVDVDNLVPVVPRDVTLGWKQHQSGVLNQDINSTECVSSMLYQHQCVFKTSHIRHLDR